MVMTTPPCQQSRKAQEDIPCDNQLDLEGQLQDVRRTVAVMQVFVVLLPVLVAYSISNQ